MKRNEAAKSLKNFKPQRIPNRKKLEKNKPPELDLDDSESTLYEDKLIGW